MKLYHYDHCPYCVKARMIFGFKNVPLQLEALLNDDEETPIGLVGKKMVPILIKEDGAPMAESLDIIHYIDNKEEATVQASRGDEGLNLWLKQVRSYHYPLAMPRWVKMGLPEFQTPSAVEYFTVRKEDYIGPFAEHLENTDQLIAQANEHLLVLEKLIQGEVFFWEKLSLDDFHVFSALRCLTTTKGVQFPEKINAYTNRISAQSGVELHWERAL